MNHFTARGFSAAPENCATRQGIRCDQPVKTDTGGVAPDAFRPRPAKTRLDEEIDPDQYPEQPREATVTVGEIEIGEQARHAGAAG